MNRGFRVYDKQEKRMILSPTTDCRIVLASNGNLINIDNFGLYLMDRYVRMDSIGIPDKNGKEIYEGDIVIIEINKHKKTNPLVATWHPGETSFPQDKARYGLLDLNNDWNTFEDSKYMKIVGNRYENPELVKGQI